MTIRLLDTNILSYIVKNHKLSMLYQRHVQGFTLAASFMTIAEMLEGAALANWGERRMGSLAVLFNKLIVLDANIFVCRCWANVRAERRAQPIGIADAWIAATALAYRIELVTHNPSDFRGISGLTVITEAP